MPALESEILDSIDELQQKVDWCLRVAANAYNLSLVLIGIAALAMLANTPIGTVLISVVKKLLGT